MKKGIALSAYDVYCYYYFTSRNFMKSKIITKFLGLLCLVTISVNQTFADDIKVLSDYLKSLKSISIDFTQYDARNGHVDGKLVIIKPDYFRCNYYKPYPLLIVGNKKEVAMYDYELEQATHIDKKENIFNFLLTDLLNLIRSLGQFFVFQDTLDQSSVLLVRSNCCFHSFDCAFLLYSATTFLVRGSASSTEMMNLEQYCLTD